MRHQDPELEDTTFTTAALAMVENIDLNVGRINKKLKKLRIEENTIVLCMSITDLTAGAGMAEEKDGKVASMKGEFALHFS